MVRRTGNRSIEVVDEQLGRVVGVLGILGDPRSPNYSYDRITADGKTVAGVTRPKFPDELADVTPDRWGRKLVDRDTGRTGQPEHVYLEHMADVARPGSLRFRDAATGEFWGAHSDIPKMIHARDVLAKIRAVTSDPTRRVSSLIEMGSSSIGGARPKAQLRDGQGHLWVAKFAAGDDSPRVEAAVMQAASACGITTASTRVESVSNSDVVLSRRFDRDDAGGRIGMRSMRAAVLALRPGGNPEDLDWVDLAELDPTTRDEVFRRAAFGVLVHNTDDHARNHSQLRSADGEWHLSPAYDITTDTNPNTAHKMSVCGAREPEDAARSLGALAEYISIDRDAAAGFVQRAAAVLSDRGLLPYPELARSAAAGLGGGRTATGAVGKGSETCVVCGRPLTDPESIARGAGPHCAKFL